MISEASTIILMIVFVFFVGVWAGEANLRTELCRGIVGNRCELVAVPVTDKGE